MWKKSKKPQTGFTLMELIISLGLVAILSAAAMSLLGTGSKKTARDTRRRTDMQSVASGLAMYRNDNGTYPASTNLTGALVPNYISVIPSDPLTSSGRVYAYGPTDAGGGACDGTSADRCVKFVLCAAGEKITTADTVCSALSCGLTCSISVTSL